MQNYLSSRDSQNSGLQDQQKVLGGPKRPATPSVDHRVVGETDQLVPAEVDFDQQDSDRSICGSEASISNRSSSGKPRVAKVSRRPPQQEHVIDAKQRLAAMGPAAFHQEMLAKGLELTKKKAAT
jgi:hypothetical protein